MGTRRPKQWGYHCSFTNCHWEQIATRWAYHRSVTNRPRKVWVPAFYHEGHDLLVQGTVCCQGLAGHTMILVKLCAVAVAIIVALVVSIMTTLVCLLSCPYTSILVMIDTAVTVGILGRFATHNEFFLFLLVLLLSCSSLFLFSLLLLSLFQLF